MEFTDTFSSIWDISSCDEDSPAELQPNVVDDIDEEFLMMVDEDDNDAAVGLLDEDDISGMNYESSVLPSYDDALEFDSTPSDSYMDYVHAVTPEPRKEIDDIRVPDMQELRIQYNHALNKLAESMRRSEVARHRIACQRLGTSSFTSDTKVFSGATEFFSGSRATITSGLEESRQRLWTFINSHKQSI